MTLDEYKEVKRKMADGMSIRDATGHNETYRKAFYVFQKKMGVKSKFEDPKVALYKANSERLEDELHSVIDDMEKKKDLLKEIMRKRKELPDDKYVLHSMIKVGVLQSIVKGLNNEEPWAVKEGLQYLKSVDPEYKEKTVGQTYTPDDYKKMIGNIKGGQDGQNNEIITRTQAN